MPDSPKQSDSSPPIGSAGGWSRAEIDAAIAGLDRATRKFTSQVDALAQVDAEARLPYAPEPTASGAPLAPRQDPLATGTHGRLAPGRRAGFDEQMSAAEREARDYLEQAKRRADSLVQTMIGAVEREAAQIRQEAEQGIRDRWQKVESEAGRYLEDCRRVAEGMVAERQSEIGELSDGIVGRARSLTSGLDDAERVRAQFDSFVRALAATSNQIAEEAQGRTEPEIAELRSRPEGPRRGALAA